MSPSASASPGASSCTCESAPCTWSPAPTALSRTRCALAAFPLTQMPPFTPLLPARSSAPITLRARGLESAFSRFRSGPACFGSFLPLSSFSAAVNVFSFFSAWNAPGSKASSAPPPAPLSASLSDPPEASAVIPPCSAPTPSFASGPTLRNGIAPVMAPPAAEARTAFQSLPSLIACRAPMPPGMKLAASESPVTRSCPAGLCRNLEVVAEADLIPAHALPARCPVELQTRASPPDLTKPWPFRTADPSGVCPAALLTKLRPLLKPVPTAPTTPVFLAHSNPEWTLSPSQWLAPGASCAAAPALWCSQLAPVCAACRPLIPTRASAWVPSLIWPQVDCAPRCAASFSVRPVCLTACPVPRATSKTAPRARWPRLLIPSRTPPPRLAAASAPWPTVPESECSAWEAGSDTFFLSQLPRLKRGVYPSLASALNVATAFQRWLLPRDAR